MRVHVRDDEAMLVGYLTESEGLCGREPIEVPDELIREYDAAKAAFDAAAKKLEEFALPIYAERRRIAEAKNAKKFAHLRPRTWKPREIKEHAEVERKVVEWLNL
jgi:hypothetical protein